MKTLYLALGLLLAVSQTRSQTAQRIPADTLHWDMEGRAQITEYKGRECIRLDGGAASIRDFVMQDGVIDVDAATTAKRGFFGIQFHIDGTGQDGEWVYLRPHKSGLPDAIQYTPVLNTGLNWQIYNDAGFTAAVDIPKEEWFHLRLVITGASATFYVKDMNSPALVMTDLKCPARKGAVALASLIGASYFANVEVRRTPDVPWVHRLPQIPAGTITRWKISPSYDALQHDLERPLTAADIDSIHWKDVEAEPPGFVVLYRYYRAPHIRVTFANDFSKRLDPQPGMRLVYARAIIESDREQTKKLSVGYSDDVSVFLNGQILWRGRSAQNFRDPGFLGIMNPENDAVYLPLRKGKNELVLAVSELGGGWGFICRVAEMGE